jgi:hypothetical protein
MMPVGQPFVHEMDYRAHLTIPNTNGWARNSNRETVSRWQIGESGDCSFTQRRNHRNILLAMLGRPIGVRASSS